MHVFEGGERWERMKTVQLKYQNIKIHVFRGMHDMKKFEAFLLTVNMLYEKDMKKK